MAHEILPKQLLHLMEKREDQQRRKTDRRASKLKTKPAATSSSGERRKLDRRAKPRRKK